MEQRKPKVGLALGSGGARGIAHVGVLDVFEKENIPIDYIAGSSMGSLVGALFALGHSATDLEELASLFKRKYFVDFTVPKMGLINGKRIEELIYMLTQGKNIEDLEVPLSIVTTDLQKGRSVILDSGSISKAVRASISIPGIFVPVQYDGKILVDGGIVDRVPIQAVRNMGADIVIAVDVSFFPKDPPITSIYDVIMQSMEIMGREIVESKWLQADVLMRPILKQHSTVAFQEIEALVEQGRVEASHYVEDIRRRILNWEEKR
ncbi:patatin-like phospholipase family protein [Geomicrobium sp. JCM 19038]|uniref:patatin-like phospholipase family protein n=1 Tax=Geomicrobium sp. JCM 19038 TaxID=1460635 RepID=UPI00045F1FF1|nr:patatin-like phospholipase family protein [Geomicrobium sp. JCM 19038]GAK07408.1 YchK protein [Geomicrobium sp. JCM 19038]